MARRTKQIVGISVTVIIYIIHLVFTGLASKGYGSLFPESVSNASANLHVDMTPVGATFSIWGVIYVFQLLWMIYVFVSLFRSGLGTNVLTGKFYAFFNVNVVFVVIWLFLFTRENVVGGFVVIVMSQIFADLSIYTACVDLHEFLATHDENTVNKVDIWCHRILIQNGLLFYATWTTVATLLSTAIMFAYELGVTTAASSIVALSLLVVLTVAWFLLENFVFQAYTEFTFTAYIALVWALSGIHANVWAKRDAVAVLNLVLLVITCVLLVARIVILFIRHAKKASYETIGYNAKQDAVTA